jgi:hypothetical protein
MKYLKKLSYKLRWVGPLAACVWWTGVYAKEIWQFLQHLS